VDFLVAQENIGAVPDSDPVSLTPEQFEAGKQVYFNLCAGCQGLCTGATAA